MCIVPSRYFDNYVPLVRSLCDPLYGSNGASEPSGRHEYYSLGISLSEELVTELDVVPNHFGSVSPVQSSHNAFPDSLTPPLSDNLFDMDIDMQPPVVLDLQGITAPVDHSKRTTNTSNILADHEAIGSVNLSRSASSFSNNAVQETFSSSPASSDQPTQPLKVETGNCCEICGYRPKGDPRWFHGSMQKHKKLQHSSAPPKIYKCPYPGCNSAYKNRPDNLRQHQIEKNHFVEGEEGATRRPTKRKKTSA